MTQLLIVEDEANLRVLYEQEFMSAGYEVTLVKSGEEALTHVEAACPDVIILDIRLAGMDGLQTMQRLLQRQPTLPIVINSAYSSFMDDFKSWPAHAYVIKSSDLSELKARVRECLEPRPGLTANAPSPPKSA